MDCGHGVATRGARWCREDSAPAGGTRILHILDHSVPLHTGYAYRTLGILREQAAMGFEVLPLTGPKQPHVTAPTELVSGWHFVRTDAPMTTFWAPGPVKEYAIVRALARRVEEIARQWRPTILHAHSPMLNALAALKVGARLKVPVVYEVRASWEDALVSHGRMNRGIAYALARFLETYCVRSADAVVTISQGLAHDLLERGVNESNLFMIPNAVDVRRFAPEAQAPASEVKRFDTPVIGFIGSFYSYEGLDILIRAGERLVGDRPEIRFLLVGGGPEEDRLRELCAESEIGAHVTFAGWLPNDRIIEAYRDIDILVYPRRRNRLTELVTPLKPLEAMALGKIVLASDVEGHRELIEDGRTGFLFRADDVSDLVVHLRNLLEARQIWPSVGLAARQFIERERNWQAVAATYAKVYERASARSRQAGSGDRF